MFEDPDHYNDCNEFTIRTAQDVLNEYRQYIQFGENDLIMDLGSGSGNVTAEVLLPVIPHPNFRLVSVNICGFSKHYELILWIFLY